MSNELVKSIRRIVGAVPIGPVGLLVAEDRERLGTTRGVAFVNSRGDVSTASTKGDDELEDQPSTPVPPADDPGVGGVLDNDTGAGGITNDGTDPSGAASGDVDDVVAAAGLGDQVGTVTGTDVATGLSTTVNVNTVAGIEYNAPPGWPSPDIPPALDTVGTTPTCLNIGCPAGTGDSITVWFSGDGKRYSSRRRFAGGGLNNPPWPSVTIDNCVNCAAVEGFFPALHRGTEVFSEAPPRDDDTQPADSICAVVFDSVANGFKGHVNDPDCSAAQKLPAASYTLRSVSDPTKYYKHTRLADGSVKIVLVDAGGTPVPDSTVKIVDEGGRVESFVPVSIEGDVI